jgi:hypothetical protein
LSSRLLPKNLKIKIYKTIVLSVVLYGCETRSLVLRGKRILRVSESRVLRTMFGSKREEVECGWRKLHNEELCTSPQRREFISSSPRPDRLWGPPRRETDHSPPSSAEVKNAWGYTCTLPYIFMAWCLIKQSISSWRGTSVSTGT